MQSYKYIIIVLCLSAFVVVYISLCAFDTWLDICGHLRHVSGLTSHASLHIDGVALDVIDAVSAVAVSECVNAVIVMQAVAINVVVVSCWFCCRCCDCCWGCGLFFWLVSAFMLLLLFMLSVVML